MNYDIRVATTQSQQFSMFLRIFFFLHERTYVVCVYVGMVTLMWIHTGACRNQRVDTRCLLQRFSTLFTVAGAL